MIYVLLSNCTTLNIPHAVPQSTSDSLLFSSSPYIYMCTILYIIHSIIPHLITKDSQATAHDHTAGNPHFLIQRHQPWGLLQNVTIQLCFGFPSKTAPSLLLLPGKMHRHCSVPSSHLDLLCHPHPASRNLPNDITLSRGRVDLSLHLWAPSSVENCLMNGAIGPSVPRAKGAPSVD